MIAKCPLRKSLAAICRESPQTLAEATPGILSAVIVTTEGREIAAVPHGQHIMIEAKTGKVIMLAIPGSEYGLLLAVIAANQAILSHLLWACRNCCNTVAKELGGNDLAKLGIQR